MAKKKIKPTTITDKIVKALGMSKHELQEKQSRAKRTGLGIPLVAKKTTKVAQTKAGKKADAGRKAMPSGLRISKTGRLYTEKRSNRVD